MPLFAHLQLTSRIAAGIDPNDHASLSLTHLRRASPEAVSASQVRLSGWCHRIRDHGGLLFIDLLRDHYGITQVVADPDSAAFKLAETLRAEWVVRIDGKLRKRPASKHQERPICRPARSQSTSTRSKCWGASQAKCRCRFSAIRNIRRRRGSPVASSICATAKSCITISCCAAVIIDLAAHVRMKQERLL